MTQQQALVLLNAIPGLSGEAIRKLLGLFESPQDIFLQKETFFLDLGFSQNLVTNIVHFPKDKFLACEYNYLAQKGAEVVTWLDEDYPSALKPIKHPPIVLYIQGDRKLLSSAASIALVGSRQASSYGLKVAEDFASFFAKAGLIVVSGLATGIDTASHRGSLKAQGKTIAVLGCGLNYVYPKENKSLYEEIARNGLIISEFPMDTSPLPYNFPRRNRIVSGLSLGIVVIEAQEKSGALITADFALEQNKEIFAVPGSIHSSCSQGTNRLIKEGAKLALSAQEVIEELGLELQEQLFQENVMDKAPMHLSEMEHKVYAVIDAAGTHIDVIATQCQEEIGTLMSQVLNLELKGVIKQLPGQFYIKT